MVQRGKAALDIPDVVPLNGLVSINSENHLI